VEHLQVLSTAHGCRLFQLPLGKGLFTLQAETLSLDSGAPAPVRSMLVFMTVSSQHPARLRPKFEVIVQGLPPQRVLEHLQQTLPDTRPPGSVTFGGTTTPDSFNTSPALPTADPQNAMSVRNEHPDLGVRIRWAGSHAMIALPADERRPWSPWLYVEVEPASSIPAHTTSEQSSGTDTRISCKLSPAPGLWAGYALALIASSAVAGFGLCLTLAQWMIGSDVWGWWLIVSAVVFGSALLALAAAGQRISRDQMDRLQSIITDAIKPLIHQNDDPATNA